MSYPLPKAFSLSILVILTFGLALSGRAVDEEKAEKKKLGSVIIPVVFYMPETKWAFGAGGLLTYRPEQSAAQERPSSVGFYVIYTQLKQFSTEFEPEIYLAHEKYMIKGLLTLEKFPDKFWGIGPDTPDEAEEDYTPRTYSIRMSFQKKLFPGKKIYAGAQYQFENFKILKVGREVGKPPGILSRQAIAGSSGGAVSGLGGVLSWDSRDNIFFPTRGNYWQISGFVNKEFLGSDFDFASAGIDLRKYVPFFKNHVLGLQALFESVSGSPPFHRYSDLGGDSIMRGYYSGRYRDKLLFACQAEYRFPVWKRFGLVGFGGLGDVAPRLKDLDFSKLRYSLGWGIRYKVVPKEGTNLRLDFAYGKGTSGIYFTAGEAF